MSELKRFGRKKVSELKRFGWTKDGMSTMSSFGAYADYADAEAHEREAVEKERREILQMVIASTQVTPAGMQALVEAIRSRSSPAPKVEKTIEPLALNREPYSEPNYFGLVAAKVDELVDAVNDPRQKREEV